MTRMPTISVCVPTRNRAAELKHTLSAMQSQTRPYTELIVGDDASDDHTAEVVASFQEPRIRYIRHVQNVGIYANWNALIGQCSGEYICIYHDHDRYLPTILEQSASLLDRYPDMSFVHTALVLANRTGEMVDVDLRPFPSVMPGQELRANLANGWHSPVMAATTMVRRSAYERVGPYQYEKYGLGCDKHMWFQLAGVGTVGYVQNAQAVIQMRERGVGTAKPSWSNEMGMLRMRAEEIDELYHSDAPGKSQAQREMLLQRDRRLLTLAVRALVLDRPEEWALHEKDVIQMLGAPTRLLYHIAKPLRELLRIAVLPLHYKRIERSLRRAKKRADIYAQQNPHLTSGD
jgi:cellulose synthase/poly-beta-1,6-N-acetylglucosamine synthase-like glycosyltransferase